MDTNTVTVTLTPAQQLAAWNNAVAFWRDCWAARNRPASLPAIKAAESNMDDAALHFSRITNWQCRGPACVACGD